jgi:hypothetical protein
LHTVILSQLGEIAKLLASQQSSSSFALSLGKKVVNVVFGHFSLVLSSWQFLCLMQTRSLHRMKSLLQPFVLGVVVGNVA